MVVSKHLTDEGLAEILLIKDRIGRVHMNRVHMNRAKQKENNLTPSFFIGSFLLV